jgi:hypothetical protein
MKELDFGNGGLERWLDIGKGRGKAAGTQAQIYCYTDSTHAIVI